MSPRTKSLIPIAVIAVVAILSVNLQIRASHPPADARSVPKLMQTCLISSDLDKLVQFYEPVLQMKAKRSGPDYAEFSTAVGILAIFSAAAQEKYIPGSAEAAKNKSLVLMARRERQMIGYAHAFVQLLEKLQNWEGTDIIEIGEETEPALRLVTDAYNAAA